MRLHERKNPSIVSSFRRRFTMARRSLCGRGRSSKSEGGVLTKADKAGRVAFL